MLRKDQLADFLLHSEHGLVLTYAVAVGVEWPWCPIFHEKEGCCRSRSHEEEHAECPNSERHIFCGSQRSWPSCGFTRQLEFAGVWSGREDLTNILTRAVMVDAIEQ